MNMSRGPAIGIDFGTTTSCVGVWRNGRLEVIPNECGNYTTPSYVAFTDSERLVGDAAKSQVSMNPTNTVFSAKRLFGQRSTDHTVISDKKHWPFEVIYKNGQPMIQVEHKGEKREFCAEQIAAMILTKMKEIAEAYLGETVTDAVITVPARFNDSQRAATRNAGTIAGLNVLRTIREPTAAAVAFGVAQKIGQERNVLVFDIGGGFTNVAVLTIEDGIFDVKSYSGDCHLGGEDFDSRMVNFFIKEFGRKFKKDLSGNKRSVRRLRTACERAKRTLSSITEASIEIDSLFEGIDFYTKITRSKFEELCGDLFRSTLEPVEKALRDARLDKSQVHDVVMVGGSCRIPKVQKLLQDFFSGIKLNKSLNPDEAVACGAAVQAAIVGGDRSEELEDLLVYDVVPFSLGVETAGGAMIPLIRRNSTIPKKETQTFHVEEFGDIGYSLACGPAPSELQTETNKEISISVRIYEGERVMTTNNNFIGKFELVVTPPMPSVVPQIDLTFDIDCNGILNVSTTDKSTGRVNKLTVISGRLSAEELERMIEEAELLNAESKEHRDLAAARDELVTHAFNVRSTIMEVDEQCKTILVNCTEVTDWAEDNLTATLKEIEDRQQKLRSWYKPILAKVNAMTDDVAVSECSSQEIETKLTASEARVNDLAARLTRSETRVQELEAQLATSEQHSRDLTNSRRDLVARLTQSEARARDYSNRLEESETRTRDLSTRLSQYEAHVRDLQARQAEQSQSPWVISRAEVRITQEEIGRGGWGSINVAVFRGQRVAAKMLHSQIISPNNLRLFSREMTMSARVHHPHIVQFIGATTEGVPIILLELMTTSLRHQLALAPLPTQQVLSIANDISRALNYLHLTQPRPIIHRDMSSANVLLEPSPPPTVWKAKLSDFGSTNFVTVMATAGPGNPLYAAPEAFNPYQQTPKMDVFSFGVVLIESFTREMPSVEDRGEVIGRIGWKAVVPLIRHCIEMNQDRRPTMEAVLAELSLLQRTVT